LACAILAGFAAYLMLLAALAAQLALAPHDAVYHLFGKALGPADVAHRIIRRGVMLGLLLPLLMVVELLLEGWEESSLRQILARRTGSSWSDIAVFLFWSMPGHTVLGAALSFGAIILPAEWLHRTLADATGVSVDISAWPLVPQVLAFFVFFSFFDYWQHRLDHTARFWPLHRYHHAAEEFCVLTSVRVHPAGFSTIVAGVIPPVLVGTSDEALFWFVTLTGMIRYLIHTRISSDFGWVGRWVLQSPAHHRLHHKLDMSRPTGNFALVPFWDRLFGTWDPGLAGKADQSVVIGVSEPYRQGLWVAPDLARDYLDFWRGLLGRRPDRLAVIEAQRERA
jgi:sterol desaturase/sphingolipid hydroxylase (fatty acid hydroxylase superfamily)